MLRSLQGAFDRRIAEPRRVSSRVAAIVGGAVAVGSATPNRPMRALCYGIASAIGVGIPMRWILEGERDARQEARDLWGLSHTMTDGRPWPPPGGWALGADAIAWLLREMHTRNSHVVVELGPGTSSIVLASSAAMDLKMVGIEHDQRFLDTVSKQLALSGLDTYRLEHIPLKARTHGQRTVQWYDDQILDAMPDQIDVLIVDGPPNWSGTGNRSPAWGALGEKMDDGALILVDDTHRPDERDMVGRWIAGGDLQLLHDGDTFMALEVKRAQGRDSNRLGARPGEAN